MKTWAQVLSNPDQPDNATVIEIAEAEEMWDLAWTSGAVSWLNVEVTEATGTPQIGDLYDGEKFVHV